MYKMEKIYIKYMLKEGELQMKSWIHEIAESYVSGHKPVRRDIKENYVHLTEEQRFDLLSENVLNYIDEQLQNAYGFGWDDLTEERKKSLAQRLTFGLLGRRQVPEYRSAAGATPQNRMHDVLGADLDPDPDQPSAYRWTENDPAPKAGTERGILGQLRQKLIGASGSDERALQRGAERRRTGAEREPDRPDTRPQRRTVSREVTAWQPESRIEGKFNFNKGDVDPDEVRPAGHYPTGKTERVEQHWDANAEEWRDGDGGGQSWQAGGIIGSGHGMRPRSRRRR